MCSYGMQLQDAEQLCSSAQRKRRREKMDRQRQVPVGRVGPVDRVAAQPRVSDGTANFESL
jgi:hypothetical protein